MAGFIQPTQFQHQCRVKPSIASIPVDSWRNIYPTIFVVSYWLLTLKFIAQIREIKNQDEEEHEMFRWKDAVPSFTHSAIFDALFFYQQEKNYRFVKHLVVVFISGETACVSRPKSPQGFLTHAVSWNSGRMITQDDIFAGQWLLVNWNEFAFGKSQVTSMVHLKIPPSVCTSRSLQV